MKKWTDNFGVTKPINELQHSHLQNIIKLLHKKNPSLEKYMSDIDMKVNFSCKSSCIGYLYIAIDLFKKPIYNFKVNGEIAEEMIDKCIVSEIYGCQAEELDDVLDEYKYF